MGVGRSRRRGVEAQVLVQDDLSFEEYRQGPDVTISCLCGVDSRLADHRSGLRRNKLEMILLATEHRQTLELEPVPIRPTKPFFFSKVASYAGEDLE
jgi:hypothetical protein